MSTDRDLKNNAIEILPGRLYYISLSSPPAQHLHANKHFFSVDKTLVYWNFFLDFGPLNLGQTFRFCALLNGYLSDSRLTDKVIYFFTGSHPHKRTNAAFLISAWALLCLNKSPEDAFAPFNNIAPSFPPWHDATQGICTFKLGILDTLRGLHKARECKFFDFSNFDIEEYEHFEKVEKGDLNWCMDKKFVAFAGPNAAREMSPGGYQMLSPDYYVPYFKRKNVTLVVRLNKKYYDASMFTNHGIDHMDLYFLDGSNPPASILSTFIQRSEETRGAVAVHCKAGLGRTGTCIGCYMMKHYRLTAEEVIGWLRITRPGSIIGQQQYFMKEMQERMWQEGEAFRSRARLASPLSVTPGATPGSRRKQTGADGLSSDLDDQVVDQNPKSGQNAQGEVVVDVASSMPVCPVPIRRNSSSSTQLAGAGSRNLTPTAAEVVGASGKERTPTPNRALANVSIKESSSVSSVSTGAVDGSTNSGSAKMKRCSSGGNLLISSAAPRAVTPATEVIAGSGGSRSRAPSESFGSGDTTSAKAGRVFSRERGESVTSLANVSSDALDILAASTLNGSSTPGRSTSSQSSMQMLTPEAQLPPQPAEGHEVSQGDLLRARRMVRRQPSPHL